MLITAVFKIVFLIILSTSVVTGDVRSDRVLDSCSPVVIAHRGASGYVPEHTLGAYALAITMGADYIEPDLVMTRDGVLISRHDNELGLTTDISNHPEFASRYRTQQVDGSQVTGWFTEDFTLTELKTLNAIERMPAIRPGNARMDGAFKIPTMQEIIDLAKSMEASEGRIIGIYPEIKHGTHFKQLNLSMEKPLVDLLHSNDYTKPSDPIYIQSFEVNNLKEMKNMTELRLLQLYGAGSPYDQVVAGTSLTYLAMATAQGLLDVADYAYAVGPDKTYIIIRNLTDNLGTVTSFVTNAHAAGLKVHPYTFRSENQYLPAEFRSNDTSGIGNMYGELEAFIAAGVDGFFTDQPDIGMKLPRICQQVSGAFSNSATQLNLLFASLVFLVWIFNAN